MVLKYTGQNEELLHKIQDYNKYSIKFYNLGDEHQQCVLFGRFEEFLNNLFQLAEERDPEWLVKEKRNFLNEFHKLGFLAKKLKNLKIKLNQKTVTIINSLSEYSPIRYHVTQFAIGFGDALLSPFKMAWHPVETAKGMFHAICHPFKTLKGVATSAADNPPYFVGNMAGSFALGAVGGRFIEGTKLLTGPTGPSVVATFPHPSGIAIGKLGSKVSIANSYGAVAGKISTIVNPTVISNSFGPVISTAIELTEQGTKESKQNNKSLQNDDDDFMALINAFEPNSSGLPEDLNDFVELMTTLKPQI